MPNRLRTALTAAAATAMTATVSAAALTTQPTVAATLPAPSTAPSTASASAERSAEPAARAARVDSLAVSFRVRNVNRSQVPCAADGKRHTIRGHLVGPAGSLDGSRLPLVTTYLHGLSFGQFFWRFNGTKGYDYSANQARNGHVSLVIDRLGYRTSAQPNGYTICAGSRADMAHQIVTQLRSGDYSTKRGSAPRANRVVLAGHSFGGQIAQIEAYSFGDIDGLIVLGYADRIQSPLLKANARYAAKVCLDNGSPRKPTYAPFGPVAGAKAALFNGVPPTIADQGLKLLTLDPCGDSASLAAATRVDLQRVGSIKVPVLVITGGADKLFPRPAAPNQAKLFTSAENTTAVVIPGAPHGYTFDTTRLTLARHIDRWLDLRFR